MRILIKKIMASEYFDLYEVAPNVYAAIKTDERCMSNAGFINLGDKVVVFDTFLSIEAAKMLRDMILDLTGNDHMIIVNSHTHLDHYMGNCMFPESTTIIASDIAFPKFMENSQGILLGKNQYTKEIEELENKFITLKDPDEILDTHNSLIFLHNLNKDACRFLNPNMTFKDSLTIHGTTGHIELRVIETAHSHGDIVGTVWDSKVAFVGDLLFINEHPFLGRGDPYLLKKELQVLLDSDIDYFIPGHGPICSKDKVVEQMDYIDEIIALVKENMNKLDTIHAHDLPSKFHHYIGPCFRWNINFLKEYLKDDGVI